VNLELGTLIKNRFLKPQRFGVVDGGFGPQEISQFVIKLDGVAFKPGFKAGIIVVQPPCALGFGASSSLAKYLA